MPDRRFSRLLAALAVAAPLAAAAVAGEPAADAAPPLPPEPDGFALPADPEPGRALFVKHCAVCHGAEGEGDGQLSPHLKPPAGDLPERVGERSDWELYLLIRDGGQAVGRSPVMVGFGERLSDDELLTVTAFARSLGADEE
jgi:mono/diheme cytochrome c family protein